MFKPNIIKNLGGSFNYIGNKLRELYKFSSKIICECVTLILKHSTGDDLIDYKIYGNSVQDGTPTPSEPIEVVSLGEGSKNLFDVNDFVEKDISAFYSISNNLLRITASDSTNWAYKPVVMTLNPGTYTLSRDNLAGNCDIRFSFEDYSVGHLMFNNGSNSVTFTIPEVTDVKIKFGYALSDYSTPSYYRVQLEEGSEATDYVPYRSVNVITSGKNLLDNRFSDITSNGITLTLNSDKSITLNGTNNTGDTIFYRLSANFTLPAGTYTLSNSNVNVGNSSFVFYDDNNNFDRLSVSTKTFTSEVTIKPYIRIAIGAVIDNQTIYPMIEQGSTPTDYEPYIAPTTTTIDLTGHEPLRKIGDVSDYIDYDNRKIVRNIGKYEITGVESDWNGFVKYNDRSKAYINNYNIYLYNAKYPYNDNAVSNFFIWNGSASSSNNLYGKFSINGGSINFALDNEISTLGDFKNFFAEQYANGTPVTVYYQLETPTEEDITLPSIPTVEGTTIISFDNTPEPSNAWAKYYASEE